MGKHSDVYLQRADPVPVKGDRQPENYVILQISPVYSLERQNATRFSSIAEDYSLQYGDRSNCGNLLL
jgi:hypothetical protein